MGTLELYSGLASIYASRDFSDLVLFSSDTQPHGQRTRPHKVHKAIVCPRSPWLYAAVREARWRERVENHIQLSEDDEVVRLMLEYLYLLDYDPISSQSDETRSTHSSESRRSIHGTESSSVCTEPIAYGSIYGGPAISAFGGPHNTYSPFPPLHRSQTDSPLTIHALPTPVSEFSPFRRQRSPRPDPSPLATRQPNLVLHAKIYSAAHKYGIHGLKTLSLDKFKIQLTRHWDSSEFAEAIHIVYSSTPASEKDMREAVADTLGWHGQLLDKPEIEVAVMEINGLAFELLKRSRRAEPEYMHE